jgi:hypothetical protein
MFKTLVSELGADVDDDDLPDVAERPSNRGRGAPRRDTMPSPPARPYQSGDTIKLPSDFGSWSPEDKMAFISAGGVAGWAGGNSNGHGPDGDTRPTQRPDGR